MAKTSIIESEDTDNNDEPGSSNEIESPLATALTAKTAGIKAAKEGNIQYGATLFRHGAEVIKSAFWTQNQSSNILLTDKALNPEKEMLVACLLNLSMMHLQASHWNETESVCTEVLALDPTHPKALFRRCKARVMMSLLEGATFDLIPLLEAEPCNPKLMELKHDLEAKGVKINDLMEKSKLNMTNAESDNMANETVVDIQGTCEPWYYELSWNPSSGEELGVTVNENDDCDSQFNGMPIVQDVGPDREGEVWFGDIVMGINGGASSMDRLVEAVSEAKELDQCVSLRMMRHSKSKEIGDKPSKEEGSKGEVELDTMLASIAKHASGMLAGMSDSEKEELAAMLGTDIKGLHSRLDGMCMDLSTPPLLTEDQEKPSTGKHIWAAGETSNSKSSEIEGVLTKEVAPPLTPYEMTEGWLENEQVASSEEESSIILPERPVDMRSLVEEMRREKKAAAKKSDMAERSKESLGEVPLSEVEDTLKAKFDTIKKMRELKMKQHIKEQKSGQVSLKTKVSGKKGKKTEKTEKASEAWQDLIALETETRQVFKKRVQEEKNNKVFKSTKEVKAVKSPATSKVKSCSGKVKGLASSEWESLMAEEEVKVNVFKEKITTNPSPP